MKTSAPTPDRSSNKEEFDHSTNPEFLSYYHAASLSEETLERFKIIRTKLLRLMAKNGGNDRKLRVADIGCGAGSQAILWAQIGHEVNGLDVNAPLIDLARKRAREAMLDIRFSVGTATDLPYVDESMDVVMLPELLEHVVDWERCLDEAVRVLAPGGALYLSTTNVMCPVQEEFNLPAYSWYPGRLKRKYERLAVTTRPEIANHAKYPAVNWFSYFSLRRFLNSRGMHCLERLDMVDRSSLSAASAMVVNLLRAVPMLRWASYFMQPETILFATKAKR